MNDYNQTLEGIAKKCAESFKHPIAYYIGLQESKDHKSTHHLCQCIVCQTTFVMNPQLYAKIENAYLLHVTKATLKPGERLSEKHYRIYDLFRRMKE